MTQCKTRRCYKKKELVDGYCANCRANRAKDRAIHVYTCPGCNIEAKDDEKCMCCDFCEEWFHIGCIDMSEDVYDVIFAENKRVPGIQWYCSKCHSKTKEALEKYSALEKQTKSLREDVDKVKIDVAEVKGIIKNTIRHEIHQNMDEMKERESRKMNLIVFGLPEINCGEATEWSTEKKVETDIKEIESIIVEDIGVAVSPRTGVIDARRIGIKRPDAPRPLKITFRDLNVKRQVLINAKKLRTSTKTNVKDIFINPDLTPEQRKTDEKLRSEMWDRRQKGENVIIRRGEIVESDHPVRKERNLPKNKPAALKQKKEQPKANTRSTSSTVSTEGDM